MLDEGFALLCSPAGRIEQWLGDQRGSESLPARSAVELFSKPCGEKLARLLASRSEDAESTVLELAQQHQSMHVYIASVGSRRLLVAGDRPSRVREIAAGLHDDEPAVAAAAERIAGASDPSDASLEMWEEISRLNNELANLNRLVARQNAELRRLDERKNDLLGMAAHDLRSPISAIVALADFIRLDGPLSEDQASMLNDVRTSAAFMLELIDDVLDLTSVERGTLRLELQEQDLPELVHLETERLRPAARQKRIAIETEMVGTIPPIRADAVRMSQVFQNLISNAIKYSHPGGRIGIGISENDGSVEVEVADQGVGISSSEIDRIFEPFARSTARPTGGEKSTGLGLAIARRIVDAHRGQITVRSTLGEGTTFTVRLPVRS